jgi:hypothetical protein
MITGELRGRGYVGVAPGTTTLYLGAPPAVDPTKPVPAPTPQTPVLTYDQYLAKDIALRRESLDLQRRAEMWGRIGTFATASLTTLALLAVLGTWWRTGKLQTPRTV